MPRREVTPVDANLGDAGAEGSDTDNPFSFPAVDREDIGSLSADPTVDEMRRRFRRVFGHREFAENSDAHEDTIMAIDKTVFWIPDASDYNLGFDTGEYVDTDDWAMDKATYGEIFDGSSDLRSIYVFMYGEGTPQSKVGIDADRLDRAAIVADVSQQELLDRARVNPSNPVGAPIRFDLEQGTIVISPLDDLEGAVTHAPSG